MVTPAHQYAAYLESPHWKAIRQRALERASFRCLLCNSCVDLEVHHRTYERLGNERLEDLVVLCHSCHEIHHAQVGGAMPPNERILVRYLVVLQAVEGRQHYRTDYDGNARLVTTVTWYLTIESALLPPPAAFGLPPNREIVLQTDRVVHPNGTPWGGSTYRHTIEALLGRPLQRREIIDSRKLVGRRCLAETTLLSRTMTYEPQYRLRPLERE